MLATVRLESTRRRQCGTVVVYDTESQSATHGRSVRTGRGDPFERRDALEGGAVRGGEAAERDELVQCVAQRASHGDAGFVIVPEGAVQDPDVM